MPRRITSKPKCPPDTPEDVRAEFQRLAELMGGRATPADGIALLMLATSWVRWRDAQGQVAEQGNIVMSGGTAIPHPALTVAAQAQQQVVQLCRELGLTPNSRRRVPAKPTAPLAEDIDALLGDV